MGRFEQMHPGIIDHSKEDNDEDEFEISKHKGTTPEDLKLRAKNSRFPTSPKTPEQRPSA